MGWFFYGLPDTKKNQVPGGMHEEPEAGDSLVVVSQSWSHQMHPDPTGVKAHAGAGKWPEIPADGGWYNWYTEYQHKPQDP